MSLRRRYGLRIGSLRTLAGVVCGLVLVARPAHGQRWQVDLSGARVSVDTSGGFGAASLAPGFEWRGRRIYGLLRGGLTGFEGAEWAAQGRGDLSVLAEPWGVLHPLRLEVVGTGQGSYHSSDFRTATGRVDGRIHFAGRAGGAWLGAAGAVGWSSSDGRTVSAAGGTVGLWARHAGAQGVLMFAPLRLEETWFPEVSARIAVGTGRVDVTGFAGWRGAGGGLEGEGWGGADAAVWLHPWLAVTVGGGWYARDLLQGIPGGSYLSTGIRFASGRPEALLEPSVRPRYVERNGRQLLAFEVPGATTVEFVGEWTAWQPIPLARAPDRPGLWLLEAPLPSGVQRFNLIVDGERWIVPDGVLTVDDGFGGRVGLLIVP